MSRCPHQLHHLLMRVTPEDAEGFRIDGALCKMQQEQLGISEDPWRGWLLCEDERNGPFLYSRGEGCEDGERVETSGSRAARDRQRVGIVMAAFGHITVRLFCPFAQLPI